MPALGLDGKRLVYVIEVRIHEPWNMFTGNRISPSRLNTWIYPHSYSYRGMSWKQDACQKDCNKIVENMYAEDLEKTEWHILDPYFYS